MNRPVWPGLLRDAFNSTALDDDVRKAARRVQRRGMVHSVAASDGLLVGLVGETDTIHRVHWTVTPMPESGWQQIEAAAHSDPIVLAVLLGQQTPQASFRQLDEIVVDLVPGAADLESFCDCDDWIQPCGHALAAALVFAESTREDPWSLFRLRGRTRDWLVASEASWRARNLLARCRLPASAVPSSCMG